MNVTKKHIKKTCMVGLTASYLLSLPVGASVVVTSLAAFLLATVIGRVRKS